MRVDGFKLRRADFYPKSPLAGKRNFKRVLRIERDGSVTGRVFLDVPDPSHREYLICIHYLRHLARNLLASDVGVNIKSRNNPWDFELELSTGDDFNVEITSIADNEHHFEVNKREERLTSITTLQSIKLRDLRKLQWLFPDESIGRLLIEHEEAGLSPDESVPNPYSHQRDRILVGRLREPTNKLEKLLERAVDKKVAKRHSGKGKTALIIDNRTSAFDIPDYRSAAEKLRSYLETVPFPEIWFYTGFCSDDDGSNAEFSFAPLKLCDERLEQWEQFLSGQNVSSDG